MGLVHDATAANKIQDVIVALYTGSGAKIEYKNASDEVVVQFTSITATDNVFDDLSASAEDPLPAGGGTVTNVVFTQNTAAGGGTTTGTVTSAGGGGDLEPTSGSATYIAGQTAELSGVAITQALS